MARLQLISVTKRYPATVCPALDAVSLDIADGEFFVLLGPSGCGKSTMLKLIAGLDEPDQGEIYFDNDLMNYLSPATRNVAMVFQNYALYPHMTVEKNVGFPLKMRRVPRDDRVQAVSEVANALALDGLLSRLPEQLSGGQRQRVALARAIIRRPRIMLMDEPLSNLDALLRVQTREELLRLHRRTAATVVYVTHDQIEATTMGQRIGVMNAGRLVQIGIPSEVYAFPANRFVASFVGTPPMAFVEMDAEMTRDGLRLAGHGVTDLTIDCPAHAMGSKAGRSVAVGVRPDAVRVLGCPEPDMQSWEVELLEVVGADTLALLHGPRGTLRARLEPGAEVHEGDRVRISLDPTMTHLFDPLTGENLLRPRRSGDAARPPVATDRDGETAGPAVASGTALRWLRTRRAQS